MIPPCSLISPAGIPKNCPRTRPSLELAWTASPRVAHAKGRLRLDNIISKQHCNPLSRSAAGMGALGLLDRSGIGPSSIEGLKESLDQERGAGHPIGAACDKIENDLRQRAVPPPALQVVTALGRGADARHDREDFV